MRKLILAIASLVVFSITVSAQDRTQFYVGYEYNRATATLFDFESTSGAHGINASATVFLGKRPGPVGLTGEVTASKFLDDPLNTSLATVMAGITIQKRSGRAQPFIRGLAGLERAKVDLPIAVLRVDGLNDTGFAFAVGGGLDIKVKGRFAIRLFQLDYMRTKHLGEPVDHVRAGAGIRF